jgi:predicted glycoside hydrolase/deacetylase ChbG (UPF0249 family)
VSRILIVNGDDFGLSGGVNRGIVRAHEQGILTSASLMVRQHGAAEAAAYSKSRRELSVGLHVDLGEWVYRERGWHAVDELEPTAQEVEGQLQKFRRLVGRDPTHLDSHQHVHRDEPARTICTELANRLGVPLRLFGPIHYNGDFYGQEGDGTPLPANIKVAALIGLIRALPEGVTELGCHPGEDEELASAYRRERPIEVETLCDPQVRAAISEEGIELRSFAGILSSSPAP